MEYGGRSLVVVFLKQNSCWLLRPVPKCFTATQTGPVKDVHSVECSGYTPSCIRTWNWNIIQSEIQTSWLARVVRRCHNLFIQLDQQETCGVASIKLSSNQATLLQIWRNWDQHLRRNTHLPFKSRDTKQLTLQCHRPAMWKTWRKGWVDWFFSYSEVYISWEIHTTFYTCLRWIKLSRLFHFKTCSVRIQGDLFDVMIPHKCGDKGEYLETCAYTTLNEV